MKSPAILYDTKDDRRELLHLLRRLPPRRRVSFIRWCCEQIPRPQNVVHQGPSVKTWELAELARVDSSADERLSLDLWFDWWNLCAQYELDPDASSAELVRRVRRL